MLKDPNLQFTVRGLERSSSTQREPRGRIDAGTETDAQSSERLHLALVDDDGSVHHAVREMIETRARGWTLRTYVSGTHALRDIPPTRPDVVLMDLRMPHLDGVECTRRLKSLVPDLPVVMFTGCSGEREILQSVSAGACGYLLKPVDSGSLVCAVRNAIRGGVTLCPEAQSALVRVWQTAGARSATASLSRREWEILPLLARGMTNGEIALSLRVETSTVKEHLKRLFAKLGVHTREEAVRKTLDPRLKG